MEACETCARACERAVSERGGVEGGSAHLLGAVGAEHEHGLVLIGQRDAVHERPDVSEAAGRELHTGREAELGVAGELRVRGAVVEEVLERNMPFNCRDQILGRDTVT